jgi:O-antigen/teichoic acid export membrane protein
MKAKETIKTLFVLLDQALVSGYNFTLAIGLTAWLGLDKYGEFVLMWMAVIFCSSLHQQLIIAPMQAYGVNTNKVARQEFYGSLLYQQILFSLFVGLGLWGFMRLTPYGQGFSEQHVSWLLPSVASLYLMADYFRKRFIVLQSTHKAFLFDLVVYASQFCLIYYRVSVQGDIGLEPILTSMFQGLSLGVFLGLYFHEYLTCDIPVFVKQCKTHFQFSKWLLGTAITQWFAGNWFVVLSGVLLGPAAIGAIRIAQNILGLFHIPFLAIESYIPSKFMLVFQKVGISSFKKHFGKILISGLGLISICLLVLSVFSEEVIRLIYGSEFIHLSYVVQIFCVLYVFVFSGTLLRIYLRTVEKTQFIFLGYILNLLFAILCAEYFIIHWGIYGVLAGLISSQIIMLLTMFIPFVWDNEQRKSYMSQNTLITSITND